MWTSIKATKGIEKTHQLHAVVILYEFIWYVWIMEIWGLTFVHGLSYMEVMCSYDLLQVCLRYLQKICICMLYMHRSDTFYRPSFVKCVLYSWLSQWLTCKFLRVIFLVGKTWSWNFCLMVLWSGPWCCPGGRGRVMMGATRAITWDVSQTSLLF